MAYDGVGTDNISGDAGNDLVDGGAGNDRLYGGAGDDDLRGGAGDDWAFGEAGNDTIDGGDGRDYLHGQNGNDTIDGGAGNDWVIGGNGNDVLSGGDGSDFVYGQSGDNTVNGGAGNDWAYGGNGVDVINGGVGNDIVYGLQGADELRGGDGNDLLYADAEDTVIDGGDGYDTLLRGGVGSMDVNLTDASIENVNYYSGSNENHRFTAEGKADSVTIRTGFGNDELTGGLADDYLDGRAGDNLLEGGAGNDFIDGGQGTDTAVFSGNWTDYEITERDDGGYDVRDLRGNDGVDRVYNVENLQFADVTLTPVEAINDATSDLTFAGDSVAENADSGTLVAQASVVDADEADEHTYALSDNAAGRFEIDPDTRAITVAAGADLNFEDAQSDEITVTVTDAAGETYEETLTIEVTDVNEAVIAVADEFATSEDTPLTTGNVLANDYDLDGDIVQVSYFSQPEHGTVTYNDDGTFTYTPDPNYSGDDAFTYTVIDGRGIGVGPRGGGSRCRGTGRPAGNGIRRRNGRLEYRGKFDRP